MNVSEILYGMNLKLNFTKKDIDDILNSNNEDEESIYSLEIRKRVRKILFEQMRKYPYLF